MASDDKPIGLDEGAGAEGKCTFVFKVPDGELDFWSCDLVGCGLIDDLLSEDPDGEDRIPVELSPIAMTKDKTITFTLETLKLFRRYMGVYEVRARLYNDLCDRKEDVLEGKIMAKVGLTGENRARVLEELEVELKKVKKALKTEAMIDFDTPKGIDRDGARLGYKMDAVEWKRLWDRPTSRWFERLHGWLQRFLEEVWSTHQLSPMLMLAHWIRNPRMYRLLTTFAAFKLRSKSRQQLLKKLEHFS